MSLFLLQFFKHDAFPSPGGQFGKSFAKLQYTHISTHHYTTLWHMVNLSISPKPDQMYNILKCMYNDC